MPVRLDSRSGVNGDGEVNRSACRVAALCATLLAGSLGAQSTRLVSHTAGDPTTAGNAGLTSSVGDFAAGRYVAFESPATDLVSGYSGSGGQVYLWDRDAAVLRLVSHVPGSSTIGGAGQSLLPRWSAGGRYLVFSSLAADLVPGGSDTNGSGDALLWDRLSGNLTLVSRAAGSPVTAAAGDSLARAISADGRYVVFDSTATDLVTGGSDGNANEDVFRWDRVTGAVSLVSRVPGSTTTTGNGESRFAAASADGLHVAFVSHATDLVPGGVDGNGAGDILFRIGETEPLALVSHAAGAPTTAADAGSGKPLVSADGCCVVFVSGATDLIAGGSDANGAADAFFWDHESGLVRLVSHLPGLETTAATGASMPTAISADGRFVAFFSDAADLVYGVDTNGVDDAFLWDRDDGTVRLLSHAAAASATAGNATSRPTAIGADARFVALTSRASDLVAGASDGNSADDVFLWERASGTLTLVSRTPAPAATAGNGASTVAAVSADGRGVVFASQATDLVAGTDLNGGRDLFWRDASLVFSDGFESGNATAWSNVVP